MMPKLGDRNTVEPSAPSDVYVWTMTQRGSKLMTFIGASAGLVGAATVVLFFFQPWRSCPYEDMSVGCAMLPNDAAVMVIALGVAVVGAAVFVVGRIQSRRSQTARTS